MNLGWSHFGSGHSSGLEATELQRGLFVRRVRGSSEAPTRSRAERGDLAAVAGPLRLMLPPLLIPRPGQEPRLLAPGSSQGVFGLLVVRGVRGCHGAGVTGVCVGTIWKSPFSP